MDALDLKILSALDADARRPYAELARELEVSQPTITDRVRRLEDRGVIRGTMLCLEPARLGFGITAFIRIRSTTPVPRLVEAARNIPQIIEMHGITGDDCMIARVVVRSVEELGAILERLAAFGQTSTSVVVETFIRARTPLKAMSVSDR